TFDGHRQNDFDTYIYASHDFGQTWQSASGNLKGEVARTLTEDQKNQDVLYLGTETGLFVSIDRAKSWVRIKANLPTVRIDEITLHPRDNAMILATHGRALWILDHLEPIQEYAAAQAATTDAKLFTPPPVAMYRRPARDRNYEFWGDQTFYGENPPQAAVIAWINKKQVGDVKLKIADAAGREIREISGTALAKSNAPGIQSACWDLRVQPAPAPPPTPGGRGSGAARTRGRCAGRWSGRRRRAGAGAESVRRRLLDAWRAGRRIRRSRRHTERPVRHRRRLSGVAARRRQDGRYQAAARQRRSGGRPDLARAQADVRHGDGDPRAAAARRRCVGGARVADAANG